MRMYDDIDNTNKDEVMREVHSAAVDDLYRILRLSMPQVKALAMMAETGEKFEHGYFGTDPGIKMVNTRTAAALHRKGFINMVSEKHLVINKSGRDRLAFAMDCLTHLRVGILGD